MQAVLDRPAGADSAGEALRRQGVAELTGVAPYGRLAVDGALGFDAGDGGEAGRLRLSRVAAIGDTKATSWLTPWADLDAAAWSASAVSKTGSAGGSAKKAAISASTAGRLSLSSKR